MCQCHNGPEQHGRSKPSESVYYNTNHLFRNLTEYFCCLNFTKQQLNIKTLNETFQTGSKPWTGWESCSSPSQPHERLHVDFVAFSQVSVTSDGPETKKNYNIQGKRVNIVQTNSYTLLWAKLNSLKPDRVYCKSLRKCCLHFCPQVFVLINRISVWFGD